VLILVTIVDGFKIADSSMFIIVELLLNITITVDFLLRVKMAGFRTYLKKSFWNKLDFVIVIGCNLLFLGSVLSHESYGEISEEALLVFWSIA
jgi:hypothetical protein